MEVIGLMKNHTVLKKKSFHKFMKRFDDIEYMLFIADDTLHTFIMHKPKDYMKKFAKAIITFQCAIRHYSLDEIGTENYPLIMNSVSKEVNDIPELINYLHSLNRIRYWNKLSSSNEEVFYEIIDFTQFNISMYDSKNNIIFEKKMDIKNQYGLFGIDEILKEISKVYKPNDFSGNKFLDIDEKWSFTNEIKNDYGIYGVYLNRTKSIQFMYKEDIHFLISNIKSFYCCTTTFDKKFVSKEKIEEELNEFDMIEMKSSRIDYSPNTHIRFNDIWEIELSGYIEFIVYLPYFYSNLILISELNDFATLNNIYCCTSSIEIEVYGKDKINYEKISMDSDKPISLEELIIKIKEVT